MDRAHSPERLATSQKGQQTVKAMVARIATSLRDEHNLRADEWATCQLALLEGRTTHLGMTDTDIRLWTWFVKDFHQAWGEKTQLPNVRAELTYLSVNPNAGIGDYIDRFNALVAEIGWQTQHQGTVHSFVGGLPRQIRDQILTCNHQPGQADLKGWQYAT